jgi:acetyltransferase-like isoleucine patch superfamily enzyme
MKALGAIGFVRACRFLIERAASLALALCVLPPIRACLLRVFGARVGRNCVIHGFQIINFYRGSFRNLQIGDECFIGQECLFDLAAPIRLANRVTLAPRVSVLTHLNVGFPDHPLQAHFPSRVGPVELMEGVFIGAGSIILQDTAVGANTFVGAGSVVTRSVPAGVLVAGVPARVIRPIAAQGQDRV